MSLGGRKSLNRMGKIKNSTEDKKKKKNENDILCA